MESNYEDEERNHPEMKYPEHWKDVECYCSSSERECDGEEQYHTEIEPDLEDRFSVFIPGEVRTRSEHEVEHHQPQDDIGQPKTEIIEHPDQSCEDDGPRDIERISLQYLRSFCLYRLCPSVVSEKYPQENQRYEREISESDAVEEEDEGEGDEGE